MKRFQQQLISNAFAFFGPKLKHSVISVSGVLAVGMLVFALSPMSVAHAEEEKPKEKNAALSSPMVPVSSVFYLDCSHLVFDNFFEQELTRAERITLLNANIEANVGNYEACRAAANESAQERMVNAGSVGLVNGGADSTDTLTSELPEEIDEDASTDTAQAVEASREHRGATGQRGTSTVCDAIKQGLSGAKTESEKAHFEKLKNDYGCQ